MMLVSLIFQVLLIFLELKIAFHLVTRRVNFSVNLGLSIFCGLGSDVLLEMLFS